MVSPHIGHLLLGEEFQYQVLYIYDGVDLVNESFSYYSIVCKGYIYHY